MSIRLGSYEAVRQLGGGGMTTVYEALDRHLGRTVALKVVTLPAGVSPAQRQEMLTRWRREARALSHLSHPSIVTVHDVGEQDGQDYLVMEYLEGRNLGYVLERGPLPAVDASRLFDQVASGLDAIHAQGLVLRGLKPSKVMLLPDGRAKLTSLGLARHADDTMVTRAGERVGSPVFMAPEQVRGEAATAASDLWALGALLYTMLAGRPPFAGPTVDALLYQIASGQPPPVPGLQAALSRVVLRSLQKDPKQRYQSASEMAAAVHAAVSDSAPETSAVSQDGRDRTGRAGGGRLQARLPRSPFGWALPLLLVIVLLAVFIGKRPSVRHLFASSRPGPSTNASTAAPAPVSALPGPIRRHGTTRMSVAPKPHHPARRHKTRPARHKTRPTHHHPHPHHHPRHHHAHHPRHRHHRRGRQY